MLVLVIVYMRRCAQVLFVASRCRAYNRPPLVFASSRGVSEIKSLTGGIAAPNAVHENNDWRQILRRIRVRYLNNAAELRLVG